MNDKYYQPTLPGTPEVETLPEPVQEPSRPASSSSRLISVWLPNDVHDVFVRRASNHPGGISGYVRGRLIYDLTRKHHGRKENHAEK